MDITFSNGKLAKILTDATAMRKAYGDDQARRIQRRLLDLRDAPNLAVLRTLPQTRAHELTGDRKGQISIDVKHPYRLLVKPGDHEVPPYKPDGGLDWQLVTRVVVIGIEDTH